MRRLLLAGTALAGAAVLAAAPAAAGTVGSGGGMSVTLSGWYSFQAHTLDQTRAASRAGFGRGYRLVSPEAGFSIEAENTADNGITYGFEIEWAQDEGNGAGGVDGAYAWLSGDDWGRIEMGDTDDASKKMLLGAFQAHKGQSGPLDGTGGFDSITHGTVPRFLGLTDWQEDTSDVATKLIYFTPRAAGFQLAISHTPNANQAGRSFAAADNDGFQNVWGGGINWVGTFGDVGVMVGAVGEMGDDREAPTAASPQGNEDLRIWGIGGAVDVAGFTLGANWRDNRKTGISKAERAAGADAGTYWAAAVGYQAGPWGISAWYSDGRRDNTAGNPETRVERWGLGGQYAVAPGWDVRADWNEIRHANIAGTAGADNKIRAAIVTSNFAF